MKRKMAIRGNHQYYRITCGGGCNVDSPCEQFVNTESAEKAGWRCLASDLWLCPECNAIYEEME